MKKVLIELLFDSKGQGLVEYGLIISSVVLAAVGAVQAFGLKISYLFDYIGEETSEAL
jgi:Flp pilus assembly pilin Flp